MSQISVKHAFQKKGIKLTGGLRGLHPGTTPSTFPSQSIRILMNSLNWPQGFSTTGAHYDYPKDREPGWSNRLQGVTHDDTNWYITQEHVFWIFPVARDIGAKLANAITFPLIGSSNGVDEKDGKIIGLTLSQKLKGQGYYHLGDCDYFEGRVYVPIEGGPKPLVAPISVKGQQVVCRENDVIILTNQFEAPWCAFNPLNRLLYSSNFNVDHSGLSVYRVEKTFSGLESSLKGEFVGTVPLFDQNSNSRTLQRVQGGVFSPLGHLYLVSDDGTGILGFDSLTGKQCAHIPVDYKPDLKGLKGAGADIIGVGSENSGEELEGITLWDLDYGQAPHISGQIHLIMIDQFGSGDNDLYFKHYKVTNPADKAVI